MTLEVFKEKFEELSIADKVTIFNEYCLEHGNSDDMLQSFDEEFFDTYFQDKMEVCRATFFGDIHNWNDEYIRFNAYGNLESVNEFEAEDLVNDYVEEIYEYPDCWEYFIEDDEDDDDDEEEETTYICPECGHVFEQGEWDYNYDTALLDFKCPECDWEGNENEVEKEENEGDE